MTPRRLNGRRDDASGAGVEPRLRRAAEALSLDADPRASLLVASGLVFLKFLSDAFDDRQARLAAAGNAPTHGLTARDADVLRELRMPRAALWADVAARAEQPDFASLLADAMAAVERHNPWLAGVLPDEHLRAGLDPARLRNFTELLSRVDLSGATPGLAERLFDLLLLSFARAADEQAPTPRSVARVLVEMLAPRDGALYDPCCGSGSLLVHAATFAGTPGGQSRRCALYGQERAADAWRLARMNLMLHGLEADLALGDGLGDDAHPGLLADHVVADPPFGAQGERADPFNAADPRWRFGLPRGSGSFAWLQHVVHHLAPAGLAGVVLPRGATWSSASGEGEIRRGIVEADLVDCVVALPGRLYGRTSIPVCIWLLAKDKGDPRFRDRRGQALFIDAREMGTTHGRGPRELSEYEIARLSQTYRTWRGDEDVAAYGDTPGFCQAASLEAIRARGHVLAPEKYVGTPTADTGAEPFERRLQRLSDTLDAQFAQAARLEQAIRRTLARLHVRREE